MQFAIPPSHTVSPPVPAAMMESLPRVQPSLGEFNDVVIEGADVRDKFMFMLLERIDKLETHVHYLEKELERTQDNGHFEAARFKRAMLRWIIIDYRNFYDTADVASDSYWMRRLAESLNIWRGDRPLPDINQNEALRYMRVITKTPNVFNENLASLIGKHFLAMNLSDIESFVMHDELPDLL